MRHKSIKPLSHEHHHSLVLCSRIRKGLENNIDVERIKKYSDWFYHNYLIQHFQEEELYVFPILEKENNLVKKALRQHNRLERLFSETKEVRKTLFLIEEELENHVRFEERELFNEIQSVASNDQLLNIELNLKLKKFEDNVEDEFWK